jgi:hypothetical protein
MAKQLRRPFEKCVDSPYYILEKWVERCKRYFEKRPSPHPHNVLTRGNTVNPRTFQTALVAPKKGSFKTTAT